MDAIDFRRLAPVAPELARYDWIVINSSAGKDSQAMLDFVIEQADAQGFPRDRICVVHCDLGRAEWEGTRELAERQANHYGLRFEVVKRDRDLFAQIEFERQMFPSSEQRYCTSDQKTKPVAKLHTRLGVEGRKAGIAGRPVRILDALGLRAEESPKRRVKPPFRARRSTKNVYVDGWLPIHAWTEPEVWARIKASGVPYHWAYDQGFTRLSCVFCVLARKDQLVRAVQFRPELAAEIAGIEARIGHKFTAKLSMAEIIAEAEAETARETAVARATQAA